MSDSQNENENEAATEALTLRDRGEKIAAMVEAEAAAVEAEEAAEKEAAPDGMPCPVCGGVIALPDVPPQDPNKETCPDCHGFGMTVTGSLVPERQIDQCSTCNGNGWRNVVPVYVPSEDFSRRTPAEAEETETPVGTFPPLQMPDLSQVKVG